MLIVFGGNQGTPQQTTAIWRVGIPIAEGLDKINVLAYTMDMNCPTCRGPLRPKVRTYKRKYCSVRCRETWNKRKQRAKK